jgi:outer membrane protein TolC
MGGERGLLCLFLLLGSGCVADFSDAHRVTPAEAEDMVRDAPFPKQTPTVPADPPGRIETKPDGRRIVHLDIRESLRLALRNNQAFLAEGENLQAQLLTLEVIRHSWEPALAPLLGTVSYTTSPESTPILTENSTVSISQKTPFGGLATASWTHAGSQTPQARAYSGTGVLSLTQPLLRGAGYGIAVEDLVSAERQYIYAGRTREFNRVLLHIAVLESYFGLLQGEKAIRNFERNLESTKRQALQAQIKESFGKTTRTDVYRSQLQVTQAESALTAQREQLKISRDAFKIFLGIAPELEIELAPETIDYRPTAISQDEAAAAALQNNPAWLNARERVEDARRQLAVAVNATLPRVDLSATYVWTSDAAAQLSGPYQLGSRELTLTAGIEIPLDRYNFRRDYQRAVIAERQAERDFLRARDGVVRDVQSQMIQLRQAELNMEFGRRSIRDSEKTMRLAEFDYIREKSTNRDVLEAQEQVVLAQNAYDIALVQAKISQLRLLNYIGRLTIDREGAWLK